MSAILHQHSRHPAAKGKGEPEQLRKGIFWDAHAQQYATRIGYRLDETTGERLRAHVQRLGNDPDGAVVAHAQLRREWEAIEERWADAGEATRKGLPEQIRDIADLSKPVKLKFEWLEAAEIAVTNGLVRKVQSDAERAVSSIEHHKKLLGTIARAPQHWLDLVPADIRARVLNAIAPTIHEAGGTSPTAERLTLAQALARYKTYLLSRDGLANEDGLKFKSIRGYLDSVSHCLALTVSDPASGEQVRCLSPDTPLEKVDYDSLQRLRTAWMRRVADGDYSRRTAAGYLHGLRKLLDWCHRGSGIAYRHPADIGDIFVIKKLTKATPPKYEEGIVKLRAILSAEVSNRGKAKFNPARSRARLYVLLSLNLGAYAVDIGALRHDELSKIDNDWFITRKRSKTSHQNSFESTHYLWPETHAALMAHAASVNSKNNPLGLLLLDEEGGPLYDQRKRKDLIGKVFRSVRRAARMIDAEGKPQPVELELKALRKLGTTWMENHVGAQERRLYKAGTLGDGDAAYVRDDYAKLTPALKRIMRHRHNPLRHGQFQSMMLFQPRRSTHGTGTLG